MCCISICFRVDGFDFFGGKCEVFVRKLYQLKFEKVPHINAQAHFFYCVSNFHQYIIKSILIYITGNLS